MDGTQRLYVGNLPYAAQYEDVEQIFLKSNISVKNIDISIDPFAGRNPSYCFVDFHNSEDATRALQTLQGHVIRGRPVRINLKTEKRSLGSQPDAKTYDRGWRAQNVPTTHVPENPYAYDRWSRDDAPLRWTAPSEDGRRLYVGGLAQVRRQAAVNEEMRDLFEGWNVEAVSKIISPAGYKHGQPGSHHYCFVDLPSAEKARAAVNALSGKPTPYGGSYSVHIANGRGPTKVQREQLGGVQDSSSADAAKRNLEGNWRRLDCRTSTFPEKQLGPSVVKHEYALQYQKVQQSIAHDSYTSNQCNMQATPSRPLQ